MQVVIRTFDGTTGQQTSSETVTLPDGPTTPDIVTLANQLSAVTDAVNQLILDALGGF